MKEITTYGLRISGAQNLGIDFGNVRLLIAPLSSAENTEARELAERIAAEDAAHTVLTTQLAAEQRTTVGLRAQVARLEAKLAEQRTINEAAIAGRRRFFGPVLLRPANKAWSGEVWLLDPAKKERGMGLRFASLTELRGLHPELWIVAVTDDGVLLDAWGGADR